MLPLFSFSPPTLTAVAAQVPAFSPDLEQPCMSWRIYDLRQAWTVAFEKWKRKQP